MPDWRCEVERGRKNIRRETLTWIYEIVIVHLAELVEGRVAVSLLHGAVDFPNYAIQSSLVGEVEEDIPEYARMDDLFRIPGRHRSFFSGKDTTNVDASRIIWKAKDLRVLSTRQRRHVVRREQGIKPRWSLSVAERLGRERTMHMYNSTPLLCNSYLHISFMLSPNLEACFNIA